MYPLNDVPFDPIRSFPPGVCLCESAFMQSMFGEGAVNFELLLFVRSKSYVEMYIRIELVCARS